MKSSNLTVGSYGDEVKSLHAKLEKHGFDLPASERNEASSVLVPAKLCGNFKRRMDSRSSALPMSKRVLQLTLRWLDARHPPLLQRVLACPRLPRRLTPASRGRNLRRTRAEGRGLCCTRTRGLQ